MIIDREITIRLAPREDGGLRAWSDDLPGLILSHSDQLRVLKGIGHAIIALRVRHPHNFAVGDNVIHSLARESGVVEAVDVDGTVRVKFAKGRGVYDRVWFEQHRDVLVPESGSTEAKE